MKYSTHSRDLLESVSDSNGVTQLQRTPKVRDTYFADPVWHGVCARRAVVGVDNDDGDDDGGYDKHHGEEHVLPNERHSAGGGRDELYDDQQEHSQRQQDRDAQSHLLT